MGKTSTKLAVFALVLLFHLSAVVASVDFYFYEDSRGCDGPSYYVQDVPPGRCLRVLHNKPVGSMESVSKSAVVNSLYGDGECTTLWVYDVGDVCGVGGNYTGARWEPIGYNPETNEASSSCNVQTEPTGIAYSEDSRKGRWILATDNTTDMYSQMVNIPYAQKVNWLQAHGATFEPGREMAVAVRGD